MSTTARPHAPRLTAVMRSEERVMPLELFFDLVFVLALTQCTALMADDPTWSGLARGLLVLGVLWWSWVGYAWLTSVIDPEEGVVRFAIFAAMAALLVASLCVPDAFGDLGLLFAGAYAVVRVAHIVLFWAASRDDTALRSSVSGLAVSTGLGVGILAGASAWGRRPAWTPAWWWRPCSGPPWRVPCGGSTSMWWRWWPSAGSPTPPRAASATRSPATRSPTCTSRWWRASCCSLWD